MSTDCFWKPLYNHRERMAGLGVTVQPDFVIDDHQEIVAVFPGTRIDEPEYPPGARPRNVARVGRHPGVRCCGERGHRRRRRRIVASDE